MNESGFALPDVNVLVALTNPSHVFHQASHRWLAGVARFATTPVTESGLLRLLLNPVVTGQVVSAPRGLAILAGIREDPRADFLSDDSSLAGADVDTTGLSGHKQVTDWHLLNLAVHHDGFLVTLDRRIARAAPPRCAASIVTLG